MHPCLQVAEILSLIIGQVQDSSTLYAIATSCRHFIEFALDSLWRSQGSLAPLVLCLPDDALAVIRRPTQTLVVRYNLKICPDMP
jgi:hypothetical protein